MQAPHPCDRSDPSDPRGPAAYFCELDRRFDAALARSVSGASAVSILFGGGLDSGLVVHGLRSSVPVELITVGNAGSRDLLPATLSARELGLPIRVAEFTDRELQESLTRLESRTGPLREPARSVQVALGVGLRAATNERVIAGQGADELFGGYAHFRSLDGVALQERRRRDWDRLLSEDWPRSRELAVDLGKDLRSPYLDRSFSDWALARPLGPIGPKDLTKPLQRAWARHRGLPTLLADRPKVALQYGSGVARDLHRLDRTRPRPV
ncbi:MAG: asparagine synthase-related protein [Thermoplasmata archaeon]|nr:asparagine synthase-related protein [Thermoplasmata archaeon]MCI4359375.1 asparagine synthase-related protein [Thermoplasmata archaeon]